MASFVTTAYGVVTRETSTSGELPVLTVSDDPWIDVSGMNPRPVVGDHYDGTDFTLDHTTLSVAQGNKIAALRDICADHIKNLGFIVWLTLEGDTEARPYVYPAQAKDQSNVHVLAGSAMALEPTYPTWGGELWCGVGADGTTRVPDATEWNLRFLDIAAIKLVVAQLWAHIHDAQEELKTDTEAVLAATTVNDVNAVTWTRPNS